MTRGVGIVNALGFAYRRYYRFRHIYTIDSVRFFVAGNVRTRKLFHDCHAFTWGTDVYAPSQRALTPAVIAHELKHVEQVRRYGLLFGPMYWRETLRQGYYANRFERAARRAEVRPVPFRRVKPTSPSASEPPYSSMQLLLAWLGAAFRRNP